MDSEKYKAQVRVPLDEYAYVEVTVEDTPEGIIEAYRAFKRVWGASTGLPEREMNAFIDSMLLNEPNHVETYNKMSDIQKTVVQHIKRALKRLEAKEQKNHGIQS